MTTVVWRLAGLRTPSPAALRLRFRSSSFLAPTGDNFNSAWSRIPSSCARIRVRGRTSAVRPVARRKFHPKHIGEGAELFDPDHKDGFSGVREYAERKTYPAAFPFVDKFSFKGWCEPVNAEAVIAALEPMMSENRIASIDKVCANRSFNVLPIVEGSVNYGNLSAICRSSEGATPPPPPFHSPTSITLCLAPRT
mmetsp:Transcript_37832/g.67834  ORF Transcript_37832/g.67834 Transcript_37832/m.67834 type:complete len:195 (-) Transcript_37832:1232-1816(-)